MHALNILPLIHLYDVVCQVQLIAPFSRHPGIVSYFPITAATM